MPESLLHTCAVRNLVFYCVAVELEKVGRDPNSEYCKNGYHNKHQHRNRRRLYEIPFPDVVEAVHGACCGVCVNVNIVVISGDGKDLLPGKT